MSKGLPALTFSGHLSAPGHTQSFDPGFEGGLQFVAVTSDDGNCHHTDRAQDQGILGEILTFFFLQEADQVFQHV